MTKDPVMISGDKPVQEAAKLMSEKGVGCLLITSGGNAVGIVTERDLVSKVLSEAIDPRKVLVSDVMTTPLFTISPDHPLDKAAEMMLKYGVRRLPVVDRRAIVGIITATDLAKAISVSTKDDELTLRAISRDLMPSESGPYM